MTRIDFGLMIMEARKKTCLNRRQFAEACAGQISWSRIRAIEKAEERPITNRELNIINETLGTEFKFIAFEEKTPVKISDIKINIPYQKIKYKDTIKVIIQETQSNVQDASVHNGKKMIMTIPAHELEQVKKRYGKKFLGIKKDKK